MGSGDTRTESPADVRVARVGEARYGGLWEAMPQREAADANLSVLGSAHGNDAHGAGVRGETSGEVDHGSHLPTAQQRVLVPFAVQGELVRIAPPLQARRGELPQAEMLEVLESAPQRMTPRCRHFGLCGGCQYQHLQEKAQLALKSGILQRLLARAGVAVPQSGVQVHAAEPYGYRNRVRLRVQHGKLGYSLRSSHNFLPVAECPIASPLLWRAVQALMDLTGSSAAKWPAATAELELFATDDDRALQMAIHVEAPVPALDREAPAAFRALCAVLQRSVPELRGAGLLVPAIEPSRIVQPGHTAGPMQASKRVLERQRVEVARWGEAGITYRVNGREYTVSRGAFFQVNRYLTERMVDLVVKDRHGELAMDLFAGAGLFSLPLTERFAQVVAVEIGDPAADDLRTLLRQAGSHHRAERATTLDFLKQWNRRGFSVKPDLVVADPPRAGLGTDVVRELIRLAPREFVYVSCDPVTFTRDARALIDCGYAATELHLLDLFPQSFHMETIAVFHPR